MTTYYSPGASMEDRAHVCNVCLKDNGQPTMFWEENDFDLCHGCIEKLWVDHSCNALHDKPAIIIKRTIIKEELRNEIFERDGNSCIACGSKSNLCVDHKYPFSLGGKTERSNLQTMCRGCNLTKGGKV